MYIENFLSRKRNLIALKIEKYDPNPIINNILVEIIWSGIKEITSLLIKFIFSNGWVRIRALCKFSSDWVLKEPKNPHTL